MRKTIKDYLIKFSKSPFFSPQGFLIRGLEISIIFFVLNLLGCKQYVGTIFGTTFSGRITPIVGVLRLAGVVYGFFYFAFIFIAPIFFIAAVFLRGLLYLDAALMKARKVRNTSGI